MTGYAGNQNNGRGNAGLISIMLTPILIIAVALGIFIYNLVGTISIFSSINTDAVRLKPTTPVLSCGKSAAPVPKNKIFIKSPRK